MISDSSSMLTEKRSIACRSGPISSTISTKSPPIGAGPTARSTSLSRRMNMRLERADDGARAPTRRACRPPGAPSADSPRARAGGAGCPSSARRPWRRCCRARWRTSASGHHAVGAGLQHQRRGVRGGEPVLQPVQAEVGDRRHVDQHFRDHHEQDREHEQLAGQARCARARRRAVGVASPWRCRPSSSSCPTSAEPPQKAQDAPHPGARQTRREEADRGAFADLR